MVTYSLLGAAVYGVVRLVQIKNIADTVTLRVLKPRVHKVDLSGIVFRTEIALNNPTKDQMRITKPVVTLTSNKKFLAQSDSEDKSFVIEPLKVSQIDTIELQLGWTSIGGILVKVLKNIPNIISAFKAGGNVSQNVLKAIGIPMEMKFSTYANGLFYESPETKLV